MTFVIWGGRRGDIWIGSPADRYYQERAKLAVATRTFGVSLGDRLAPSMMDLALALGQLATALPTIRSSAERAGGLS